MSYHPTGIYDCPFGDAAEREAIRIRKGIEWNIWLDEFQPLIVNHTR
jgi:hypothetical protein